MGVVFKAFEPALNRFVAIKMLLAHLAASGAARKRFAREGQAAAAVIDDNVMPIYSVAEWQGVPYLVTQYSRGATLQKRIQDQGPLELKEILRIGMQTARGLAAAHAQGLVHRDVKPSNILLDGTVERALLTDFGLARAVDDASITRTGTIAGTPQYMSPEQARGGSVDARSDLFGLGCVLYAMCTGRPPFRAESSYAILRMITDDEPLSIREINPDIPEWLCLLISRLMAKSPDARFGNALEVAAVLEQCLAHVQQPTAVALPASLVPRAAGRRSIFNMTRKGVIAMLGTIGITVLGIVVLQGADAPDIAGKWTSEEWGDVVLREKDSGKYEGTYTNTFQRAPHDHLEPPLQQLGTHDCRKCHKELPLGNIALKWSRVERRFNGTWEAGDDRKGKISLRLVGEEIRGAWRTTKKFPQATGTARLSDLSWNRSRDNAASSQQPYIGKLLMGKIHRVDIERKVAWIDMGSADSVKVGMRFQVSAKAPEAVKEGWPRLKGSVEVIRVLDQHMSEVRIVKEDLEDKLKENDDVISVDKTQASIANESLEGVWEQVLPPDVAAKSPEDIRLRLVFDGNWHAAFRGSQLLWASRLKLEPQPSPKRISFVGLEQGQTRRIHEIKGIYEVKENRLQLRIAPDTAALPTEFAAKDPEFERVKGKLAEEQLDALKRYSKEATTTAPSGIGIGTTDAAETPSMLLLRTVADDRPSSSGKRRIAEILERAGNKRLKFRSGSTLKIGNHTVTFHGIWENSVLVECDGRRMRWKVGQEFVDAVDMGPGLPLTETSPDGGVDVADDSLEGVWEGVYPPDDAAKLPEEKRLRVVFAGGWHAAFQGDRRVFASRLKVEPQHTPKRFSFVGVEGQPMRGIYEVKEDGLRLSIAPETDALPTKFGTEHPEFRRVKGQLAEEQLDALKQYAKKGASTGISAQSNPTGDSTKIDKSTLPGVSRAEGPLAKESRSTSVLEGTWAFVSIEGGRPDGKGTKRTFEAGKERYAFEGKKLILRSVDDDGKVRKTGEFDIALDTKVTPHRLTLRTTKDHLSIRYIYEVKGDTLRMCYFALGEEDGMEVVAWPSDFSIEKDTEKYPTLQTLKRVDDMNGAGGEPAPAVPTTGAVSTQPESPDLFPPFELRLAHFEPGADRTEHTVPGSQQKVYLDREPLARLFDVFFVQVINDAAGQPAIEIHFAGSSASRIQELTQSHLNQPVAMLVDGKLLSAPTIRKPFGGVTVITGDFNREEAERIVKQIRQKIEQVDAAIKQSVSDKDAGPVWGEAVDGLQLGVSGIRQGRHFKSGDTVRFGLSVRNVGTQTIRFEYKPPKTRDWVAPQVERTDGKPVVLLPTSSVRGGHRHFTETLEPGAVTSIHDFGILVLGTPDTSRGIWPCIEKPEPGECKLRAGYMLQPLDADGKPIVQRDADGARRVKSNILTSGTVAFHIDESLEGVWELADPPEIAAKRPEDQRLRFVVTGDWQGTFQGDQRISASRLMVEPQHTPKRLSFVGVEGKPMRGIYEIKEDGLRLSIAPDTEALPTKFGTEHPEFKRVQGRLADEQLDALKQYAKKAGTTATSGIGESPPRIAGQWFGEEWGVRRPEIRSENSQSGTSPLPEIKTANSPPATPRPADLRWARAANIQEAESVFGGDVMRALLRQPGGFADAVNVGPKLPVTEPEVEKVDGVPGLRLTNTPKVGAEWPKLSDILPSRTDVDQGGAAKPHWRRFGVTPAPVSELTAKVLESIGLHLAHKDADSLQFDVLRSGETVRVNVPFPDLQLDQR
ncbi:MAG: protein kinase domain-containing protein [Planctomycetales bacterium]